MENVKLGAVPFEKYWPLYVATKTCQWTAIPYNDHRRGRRHAEQFPCQSFEATEAVRSSRWIWRRRREALVSQTSLYCAVLHESKQLG